MLQGIFSLFNSYADKKIKISTFLIDDFNEIDTVIENNSILYKNESKHFYINILNLNDEKIEYRLNGLIRSDKMFQKTIKKIKNKQEISNGIFYIKHFVEIKPISRKKFDQICNYTYSKEETIKLPKNIKSIKIELYEEIIEKKKNRIFNLIAEKYILL